MKKILGLDLGTTSIGWAFVHEAENDGEKSEIIRTGVRVVPLSTDEENNFLRGQTITLNATRTEKRQARRNKFRYKLRRESLVEKLMEIGFLDDRSALTEIGKDTTFETHKLRAKAAVEKIGKEDFARVLLAINKKRGYKSTRKDNKLMGGKVIDEMGLAKYLYENNLTPGQYGYKLLMDGEKLPPFYRSDLESELEKIWKTQSQFHPTVVTEENLENIIGKNRRDTNAYFDKTLGIERVELSGKRNEKRLQTYQLRSKGATREISLPELAHIIIELNNEINQSSGYLSEISDRSKELYFNNETVGQYQYKLLLDDVHTSLANLIFYRQDYIDEFNKIWDVQAKHYSELTDELKEEIRERIIFYQRRLKSQKGLVKICEFEGVEREVVLKNGRKKRKLIGPRVAPRSSPVFQEFRIWQNINNIKITKINQPGKEWEIDDDTKEELFQELNWKGKMTERQFLKWLFDGTEENPQEWKSNFPELEYNRTNERFMQAYKLILEMSGHDDVNYNQDAESLIEDISSFFAGMGIREELFDFDIEVPDDSFDKQPYYLLWHLIYSYESDQSKTGMDSLLEKLESNFGFSREFAEVIAEITFEEDYGNLSARAMKKILPHMHEGLGYDEACSRAGYKHSGYLTKEENLARQLEDEIEILKKNSLRNPVVEKILNQMIHVVNAIIADEGLGRPDEIRIELARDLKQTKEQRSLASLEIGRNTKRNNDLREELYEKVGLKYISRNDLIKYRLYKELEPLGYKTLYTGTYIELNDLFGSNKFDIEHIIPQSKLYDDSFSNKTLETRSANIEKGNMTAVDFVQHKYGEEGLREYEFRINELMKANKISFGKKKKLLTTEKDIPEGFLNRDIGNTAYISRKAMELLHRICYSVVPTAGKITSILREDWGLIDVLKELNWEKYNSLGLTYFIENREGKQLSRIKDWTKRNDHRHHAMDAITIAFTKRAFIQYLNNLSAESIKDIPIEKIKEKYTHKDKYGVRKFKKPMPDIREQARTQLSSILVSFKAKNKVTTLNTNIINGRGKGNYKTQDTHTPRGQLHKETVYGKSMEYVTKMEKVGSSFDKDKIMTVASRVERDALLKRLEENAEDPKKAFTGKNSLKKNPIHMEDGKELPERVKTSVLEERFTIRKDISPDLNVEKVVDVGIKNILEERLKEHNGNKRTAFSDLDENPIWLNKEKSISIKRVTISGIRTGDPIHYKKNHKGEFILDDAGEKIPTDYIQTGNNHHVAIYQDEEGNLHEEVVSFFEAVERKNQGLPIIRKENVEGMNLLFTLKQNEMFIFPTDEFDPREIDLLDPSNKAIISKHLFRVQKISTKNYLFAHHLETQAITGDDLKNKKELAEKSYYFLQTELHLRGIMKIRINHLGDIMKIGEY